MPYGCCGGGAMGGAIIAGFFAGATGAERPASSCSLCLSMELDVKKSSIFAPRRVTPLRRCLAWECEEAASIGV